MNERSLALGFATAGLLCCTALSSPAYAYLANECTLNGTSETPNNASTLAGCANGGTGGGTNTVISAINPVPVTASSLYGVRSGAGVNSIVPIDAWNTCRWINNTTGNSIFVPIKSSNEWQSFLGGLPAGVSAGHCALPYSRQGPGGSSVAKGPTFPGVTCTSQAVNYPTVYGRVGATISGGSRTTSFLCRSGTETIVAAASPSTWTWTGIDSESVASNVLSWTLNDPDQYSPDMDLGRNAATVVGTKSGSNYIGNVTISWYIAPYKSGNVDCITTTRRGGFVITPSSWWGPATLSTGMPRSGSTVYALTSGPSVGSITYDFTLSCSSNPGNLNTSKTVSVVFTHPITSPPADGGGFGDGGDGGIGGPG